MTTAPRLLDQLSALTSIRDLELLEFSLLKTLHYSFYPRELLLLRMSGKGVPQMEIRYGEHQNRVTHEEIEMLPPVARAIAHLGNSDAKEFVVKSAADVHSVYSTSPIPQTSFARR